MNAIQSLLKQILETGSSILAELKQKDPDLAKVHKLYGNRADSIAKLSDIPTQQKEKLSDAEEIAAKDLFSRLHLLEKKINRMLTRLSETKQETLRTLGLHKKAKTMYGDVSSSKNAINRKIVDLKPDA